MRYCPQCRSEFRSDIERCSDCDILLVDQLPAEVPQHEWEEVFRGGATQADVASSALEAAGIETLTPDEFTSNLGLYAPAAVSRILVPKEDVADAREIIGGIHRLEAPPPEPPPELPTKPVIPSAGRLLLRAVGDTLIAITVPCMAAMPLHGRPSIGQLFIAVLLLEPSLLVMSTWRRRRMLQAGDAVVPVFRGDSAPKATGGMLVGLLFAGLGVVYSLAFRPWLAGVPDQTSPRDLIHPLEALNMVVSIGVAPICEELFFRGSLYSGFASAGHKKWGLLVSSALFAAMHPVAFIPFHFVLGCSLAILTLQTRSLVAPMVAHSTYNAVVVLRALLYGSV